MDWVTATDILNRWTGTDDIPAEDNITLLTLIEDAEEYIKHTIPSVPNRVSEGVLSVGILKIVISNMVQRAYQSVQDGRISYGSTTGPFSESGSYSDTTRGIYLTAKEHETLSPPLGKAYSINMEGTGPRPLQAEGYYSGYYYRGSGSYYGGY